MSQWDEGAVGERELAGELGVTGGSCMAAWCFKTKTKKRFCLCGIIKDSASWTCTGRKDLFTGPG